MAVISKDKLWPGPVPYVASKDALESQVHEWIDKEINKEVGYVVLVRHDEAPAVAHISIAAGHGISERIGYDAAHKETKVSASSKGSMIHEILHALGFHHEQFHKCYAWSYDEIPKSAKLAPALVDLEDKLKDSPWNKSLFANVNKQLGSKGAPDVAKMEKQKAGILSSADPSKVIRGVDVAKYKPQKVGASSPAAQQLISYLARVADKQTHFSAACDYNSIMMYDDMATAAADTYKAEKAPAGITQPNRTNVAEKERGLSEEDVLALKTVMVPKMVGVKQYGT